MIGHSFLTKMRLVLGVGCALPGVLHPQSLQYLTEQAKIAQGKAVYSAIERLAQRGESAVPYLAELLSAETVKPRRSRAIAGEALQALLRIRSPKVLPVLKRHLFSAKGVDIGTTLLAIGNHGNPRACRSYFATSMEPIGCTPLALWEPWAIQRPSRHCGGCKRIRITASGGRRARRLGRFMLMVRKYPNRLQRKGAWWREARVVVKPSSA